ncbi:hypothetical protein PQX77_016755 [Marasmius sp. AFHP31]|nr:hypothetical protein PQX77_016755 [Marasmius sp. AFHP31]
MIREVNVTVGSKSGLSLALELDMQRFSGTRSSNVQVDYDDVRHNGTHRFLNEVKPRIFSHRKDEEDDFQFKPGYSPEYTDNEKKDLKARQRKAVLAFQLPSTSPDAQPVASGSQTPLPDPSERLADRSVWDATAAPARPPPAEWISAPLTLSTLGELRVLVDILEDLADKGKDQWVRLKRARNGDVEVRKFGYRVTRWETALPVAVSKIGPSSKRPNPKTELSLMLVTEGEHMGKLVYRVGQRFCRANDDSSLVMILTRVNVVDGHLLLSSEPEFELPQSSLALVNDSGKLHSQSSKLLKARRETLKNQLFL